MLNYRYEPSLAFVQADGCMAGRTLGTVRFTPGSLFGIVDELIGLLTVVDDLQREFENSDNLFIEITIS